MGVREKDLDNVRGDGNVMNMTKRTDAHRPGAIRPQDYVPVLTYSLSTTEDGWPVPSHGVNCALDYRNHKTGENGKHRPDGRCCIIALRASSKFAPHGDTGKCSICGAVFVYGDVWQHVPTGEMIHVGHTCAEKYELLADSPEWTAEVEAAGRRRAARLNQLRRDQKLEEYYSCEPSMRDVLEHEHPILADMRAKVREWGDLTEKQVEFACRLYSEALCPERPKAEEKLVAAPEGRVTVRGRIVSVKDQESQYGITWRMTVKVTTPEGGTWLAWGTCPTDLCLAAAATNPGHMVDALRGREVEFVATLKRGRDEHFALASRPTKARLIAA